MKQSRQDSRDNDSGTTSEAEQLQQPPFPPPNPGVGFLRRQLHLLPGGQHIVLAPHQNPPVIPLMRTAPATPTPAQVSTEPLVRAGPSSFLRG